MLLGLVTGETQSVAQWDAQERHRENREHLAAARQGDLNAQWELIVNHDRLIRSTVRRVVEESSIRGDRTDLIDSISRDAVVLVRSSFETFTGAYPQLSHWIRTVSRRHALRHVQRAQRTEVTTAYDAVDNVGPAVERAAIVPSAAQTFEESVDANDRARMLAALEQCLARLSQADPRLHHVVWLQYKQGLSQQKIKAVLEEAGDVIGTGAVGKRVEKGRRTLAVCIRERMRSVE